MKKLEKQVVTVVDFTEERPTIKLECPDCHELADKIGVKFCSNCGTPLKWDNIFIRQPKPEPAEPNKEN